MRNEIKLELLKILLRRFMDISQRPAAGPGESDISFNRYQSAFNEQNEHINHYKSLLLSQNEQLATLKRIKYYLESFRKSWRFKIGDRAINTFWNIAGKRAGISAFDKVDGHIDEMIRKERILLKIAYEPSHYLNPRYWIEERDFESKVFKADNSVAIIVLNLNGGKHLQNLFESFIKYNTYKNFRFIVVDHGSEDQSVKLIDDFKAALPIDLYQPGQNFTFSYSNNFAFTKADAEYILFLNNDVVFIDDILGKYIEIFQQNRAYGIVGANLFFPGNSLFETGEIQHSGINFMSEMVPEPDNPIDFSGDENANPGDEHEKKMQVLRPFNDNKALPGDIVEYQAITGAAMMVRSADFQALHGFDENYIWGYEDVDLCLSCRTRLQKQVVTAKKIRLIHDEGATRKSSQDFNKTVQEHNLSVLNKKHGLFIRNSFLKEKRRDAGTGDPIRIAIKVPVISEKTADIWGDTHFAKSLANVLEKNGCHVRMDYQDEWYRYGYLEDDIVLVLRGLKRYFPRSGQLNLMWNISHPDLLTDEEYNGFDHVFIASLADRDKSFRNVNVPVTTLLQCTDADLFYPETNPGITKCDYLFIGSPRGQYRETVKYAIKNGISVDVFGNDWDQFIPGKYIKGAFIPNDRLRYYYSACRILFNDHWKDMSDKGFLSNRLFDAAACGCVVISDNVEGAGEIFGDSVLVYNSEQDFLKCVKEIDANYDYYKNKANIRSEVIRKEHSFEARASVLLEVIKQYLEGDTGQKAG
jgi:GT2 family glycosyltransferase